MGLIDAARWLGETTRDVPLDAPHVYRPLDYAWAPHEAYLRRFGLAPRRVVLVGMNPGPWGMGQTGIPFADPSWARGWMGIEAPVLPEPHAHPARPVLGFASTRLDPSGAKLYGWARAQFGAAERFFARFFVTNYCPLMMLDEGARNVPLNILPRAQRDLLAPPCDAWLREALGALDPALVVGLGRFVYARIASLDLGYPLRQARHPSPANPANNAGWGEELHDLVA